MTDETTSLAPKARRRQSTEIAITPQSLTPAQMLSVAVQQNADTEKLARLMDLQERWERHEAHKAYIQAMVHFRSRCPTIAKTRTTDFTSERGRTYYTYAGLPETVAQIQPLMAECQLAATWTMVKQTPDWIEIRCDVSHIAGHCESMVLGGGPDQTGNKNKLQAIASTISYLRRTTLFSLLGLVAKDEIDDDGAGGKPAGEPTKTASESVLADQDKEIKRQFVAVCRERTGNMKLPTPIVAKLYAAAEAICGESAQACLDWIRREDVILNGDGTISTPGDEPDFSPPTAQDVARAMAGESSEAPKPTAKCLKCGALVAQAPPRGIACPECGSTLGFKPL